jgi:hypothetical protein
LPNGRGEYDVLGQCAVDVFFLTAAIVVGPKKVEDILEQLVGQSIHPP